MFATSTTNQEAVMGKAVPTRNSAVVLRPHLNRLRALLAIALIGLAVAFVIVAGDDDQVSGGSSAEQIGHIRYGGFNPGTGQPDSLSSAGDAHPPITRYDGGPEEGTRGPR
jgi:hypothetical protein